MSSVVLSNTDLMLAALLLAINGGISVAFGLRLELNLLRASVRMVVQVAAIGVVLKFASRAVLAALDRGGCQC